jgi:hypothetical protein
VVPRNLAPILAHLLVARSRHQLHQSQQPSRDQRFSPSSGASGRKVLGLGRQEEDSRFHPDHRAGVGRRRHHAVVLEDWLSVSMYLSTRRSPILADEDR